MDARETQSSRVLADWGRTTLHRAPYTRTGLSYLRQFLARSGEYSYALFTLALIGRHTAQSGNKLTASVAQTNSGARNKPPSHNMYRAETVLGQRESTCRLYEPHHFGTDRNLGEGATVINLVYIYTCI